jgi:hypothetical protein
MKKNEKQIVEAPKQETPQQIQDNLKLAVRNLMEIVSKCDSAVIIVMLGDEERPLVSGIGMRAQLKEMAEGAVDAFQPPYKKVKVD